MCCWTHPRCPTSSGVQDKEEQLRDEQALQAADLDEEDIPQQRNRIPHQQPTDHKHPETGRQDRRRQPPRAPTPTTACT